MSISAANDTRRHDELPILRQDALQCVAVPAAAVGWVWLIYVLNEMQFGLDLQAGLGPLTFFACSAVALWLNKRSNPLAAAVLLTGLMVTSSALSWRSFHGLAPYSFGIAVSVAGLLSRPVASLLIALPASALIALAGRYGAAGPLSFPEVARPVALLWLTAGVTYLSARNLYRTLQWAWESADQARERAAEAMTRRGELVRALRSLDEMYNLVARAKAEETAAREAAEMGRRQKAQFAANVSHELRTPLNLIIGFSELMCAAPEVYGDFPWPEALRSDIEEIYQSSLHLQHLVDDILDLSQLDAMRMPLIEEETSIADLVRQSASMAAGLVRDQNVELCVDLGPGLPTLLIDRTRIRQVLLNLLNNAARFTEHGRITVSAHLEDDTVHIRVADTGIGMTPEQLSRVFLEFEQGDGSLRRRFGGTGLGLAVSKRFVELHGGRIWAESELGKGSVFHVVLPAQRSQHAVPPTLIRTPRRETASEWDTARLRTVVLQGDRTTGLRLLSRYVQGYRFVAASDPAETLQLVEREHPWAVVLAAPSAEEAAELSRRLDERLAQQSVPVLSYDVDMAGLTDLPQAIEWLPKPVRRADLLATLARVAPTAQDVLIVDDDPGAVQLLSGMVRSGERDYAVRQAFGGLEALEAIAKKRPGALLLDLLMPDLGGLEVISRLREDPTTRDLPILLVTAGDVTREHLPIQMPTVMGMHISKSDGLTPQEWLSGMKAILDVVAPRHVAKPGAKPEARPGARLGSEQSPEEN